MTLDLTSCPQCHLVAEVVDRDVWSSTDGPVEHVRLRCVRRHVFCLPVGSLPGTSAVGSSVAVRHAEGRA